MNRWTVLLATLVIAAFVAMGCSGSGVSPVTPPTGPEVTGQTNTTGQVQTHLWGYWDVYFDLENQTVEAIPNHHAEFAANVVTFLNSKGGLAFDIIETPIDPGGAFIDVDIDVSLTHPLAGLPMYDGYDVRGIFIGDGSDSLAYDSDLDVTDLIGDQCLMDDPDDADGGGPDGYTRWWNPEEFIAPGLLGYTPGLFATKGYTGEATLNPYKYFADDFGSDDDVWEFLTTTADHGVFASGSKNTRNYYIRFPTPVPNVVYGYAVCASWKGEDLVLDHPANAIEAMAVSTTITDDIYFVDSADFGGDFIADIDVLDWNEHALSAGVMEDYLIYIESDQFTNPYMADTGDMTPIGGSDTFSTYQFEIPADNITYNSLAAGHDGEYWVIVEYPDADYKYPDDPSVPAPDAPLAAFFRFNDLYIADEPYNMDPVCDLVMVTTEFEGWGDVYVEVDASASYDPDVLDVLTFSWDYDGDDVFGDAYDSGTDDHPIFLYDWEYSGDITLELSDNNGATVYCSTDVFDITEKSCGSPACPSGAPTTMIGSPRLYYYPPQPVQDANTRVVVAYRSYAWCTVNMTGTSMYDITYNSPSYSIRETAIASDDRIYYNDSGSSNRIYYCQYGPPFSSMRTSWGVALPSGYYVHKLSIDEDNNPIVLARGPSSSQPRVYHWNGTDWGSGVVVPSDIMTECGNNYSYIFDFDYDPSTGWYYVVDYHNNVGVYAFDDTGTTTWTDNDIWTACPGGTSWQAGIFIDKADPECRLIVMAGRNSSSQTTYWARYNPVGGEKTTGTTYGGTYGSTFSTFYGRGCVQESGTTARFLASTYGGNVWSSTIVPSW